MREIDTTLSGREKRRRLGAVPEGRHDNSPGQARNERRPGYTNTQRYFLFSSLSHPRDKPEKRRHHSGKHKDRGRRERRTRQSSNTVNDSPNQLRSLQLQKGKEPIIKRLGNHI